MEFKVVKSGVNEDKNLFVSPQELVRTLALGKAEAVAKNHPDAIVIGADTIVVLNNQILGKPKTTAQATLMLKQLSGKTHLVMTGLAVINLSTKKKIVRAVTSQLTFRKLSLREIKNYAATDEPMDKAGAYAIQGRAEVFVESISGDFTNIIGLPIPELIKALKQFGMKI